MRIIANLDTNEKVISEGEARRKVEQRINNTMTDALYIVKYDGDIISFSGEYYKFAWKTIGSLRAALTNKFGRELSEALVENNIIEIIKLNI